MVKKILNLMIYYLLRFKKKYFEDYTWKGKFKTPNECNLVDFKLNKTAINYYKEATKKFKGPEDIKLTGRHTILPVLVSNIKENKINILDFGGSSNPGISYLIKSCDGEFSSTIIETGIFVENFKNKVPDVYKDKINYRDSFKNLNLDLFDICYFGSSIQYIQNYKEILNKVFDSKIKYIVITGTFFNFSHEDFFVSSTEDDQPYLAERFFSYDKFLKLFIDKNFKCIFKNKRGSKNYKHETIDYKEYSIFDFIFKKN